MRWLWAVLAIVAAGPTALAGVGELLAPGQLPPQLVKVVQRGFGGEVTHARKLVEGDRACYLIAARDGRDDFELFASLDGEALHLKTEDFSLGLWPKLLFAGVLLFMLPGVALGAAMRWLVRFPRPGSPHGRGGLLSTWLGAVAGTGLVINLIIMPSLRQQDVLVLGAYCVLWGAVAATAIEVVAQVMFFGPVGRAARLRRVAGCCALAAVSIALTIPLDIVRIERENSHYQKLTLRKAGA
jgi:hypothetical protein